MDKISHERLLKLVSYNHDTGEFRWAPERGKRFAGGLAGAITDSGYRRICIDGISYRANRLAWFYVHGKWPTHIVDHVNGNRLDDRISNLRDITSSDNSHNIYRAPSNNTSGYLGVTYRKNRGTWTAAIKVKNKTIYIGEFKTPELAHEAYMKAKAIHHPNANITATNNNKEDTQCLS